jgi:hypothetical protein
MILILAASILAYVVIGIIVGRQVAERCRKENARYGSKFDEGDYVLTGLSVLLWPYAALAFIGFQLFKGLGKLVTR